MALGEIFLVFLHSPTAIGLLLAIPPILWGVGNIIYNLYFHPLAKFPGPRLAAATELWRVYSFVSGDEATAILNLHDQYGKVVRLAPNELSFIDPVAWKDIYGHKTGGQLEFPKDANHHASIKLQNILNADQQYHGVLRKMLAHGFSEKALREQEAVLQEYIDLMIRRMDEESDHGKKPLDLVSWYNYFTFDVIGYLTYGEPFACLSSSTLHPWIDLLFELVKIGAAQQPIGRLPFLLQAPFKMWVMPKNAAKNVATLRSLDMEKIQFRLDHESSTPDFMFKLIEAYRDGKMTLDQLQSNAQVLIAGGSETTATLLSGATFHLLSNPWTLAKLSNEIRTTFKSASEITAVGVNSCRYLLACLDESLRIYPPSPQTHTRTVPQGGAVVAGSFLPGGTTVGVPIFAICHSRLNFHAPEKFIPERWLGYDSVFASDRKDAAQVFSTGPRTCIGRNLAFLEMRLVMAKLLWHFDLELCTHENWADQKLHTLWDKPPLMVKLLKRTQTGEQTLGGLQEKATSTA